MRSFIKILSVLLVVFPILINAQDFTYSLGQWKIYAISGDVKIKGFYRQQETSLLSDDFEKNSSLYFQGGINLNSQSYIWHPNFLLLDIDLGYNPETRKEEFLVVPDRSEARSLRKMNISGTFFSKQFITLKTHLNLNQNFVNYENLSNVEFNSKDYGASLNVKNKYLPVFIDFNKRKWSQHEILTDRMFINDQTLLQSKFSKSFSEYDHSEALYAHSEYIREDANNNETNNKVDRIRFTNNLFFDPEKKYFLNSRISNYQQEGTNNFDRFLINERLNLNLPYNLIFTSNYQYHATTQEIQNYKQHLINGNLFHRLFLSLESNIKYEYYKVLHDLYSESNSKSSLSIKYTKKIPLDGRLTLSYYYLNHYRENSSNPALITVINEEYVLNDDEVTIINNPNIDIASLLITDETGTIIYQENLDYIIIQRENYIEVQRIPGGQIENGTTIFIDYTATIDGSYHYTLVNNNFGLNVSLWKNFVEFYYRLNNHDYKKINGFDVLNLNIIQQNIVGARFKYKSISTGLEYNKYNSTIVPYNLLRYFVSVHYKFTNNILCSLTGNIRNYEMLDDDIDQLFTDFSGNIVYQIDLFTRLNFEAGYRNQTGQGIDLNLLTIRTELTKTYRKLYFTIGAEMYNRNYIGETVDFKGGFIQIVRKF